MLFTQQGCLSLLPLFLLLLCLLLSLRDFYLHKWSFPKLLNGEHFQHTRVSLRSTEEILLKVLEEQVSFCGRISMSRGNPFVEKNQQESSIMCSELNGRHLFPSTRSACCNNYAHFVCAHLSVCLSRSMVTSTEGTPFFVTPSHHLGRPAGIRSLSTSDSARRHGCLAMLRSKSVPRALAILVERSGSLWRQSYQEHVSRG